MDQFRKSGRSGGVPWAQIAESFTGRPGNDIKNRYNNHLKPPDAESGAPAAKRKKRES